MKIDLGAGAVGAGELSALKEKVEGGGGSGCARSSSSGVPPTISPWPGYRQQREVKLEK